MENQKREKRFNKEFKVIFGSSPIFETIKKLYVNDDIKNIKTAENFLVKIKYTKSGELNKNSLPMMKKLLDLEVEDKGDEVYYKKLIINDYMIQEQHYNYKTNRYQFQDVKRAMKGRKNILYVQTVKFYNEKKEQITMESKTLDDFNLMGAFFNDGSIEKMFNDYNIDNNGTITMATRDINKQFYETVDKRMTANSDFEWVCIALNKLDNKYYSVIETRAFKEIKTKGGAKKQIYKENDTGTCVYDGFLNFFETKSEGNRNAKAIYNKLIKEEAKYKKAYTDETLSEICEFTNSSLTIRDLIHGKDKIFKTEYARFSITFINTKFNHLDLTVNEYKDIQEVSEEEMEALKFKNDFYIEHFGTLTTLDTKYKIKDTEFKKVYKEWKKENKYHEKFILEESDEYKLIKNFDYNLHSFFRSDCNGENFLIDDNLYDELDIKKSYYNYSNIENNKFYRGIPSGSFINVKVENNYFIKDFEEHLENGLIGYYNILVVDYKSKGFELERLGIKKGLKYVFTSCQIELLKNFIEIEFLYISFSVACDMKFNEKFLEKFGGSGLSYYCKAWGMMLCQDGDEFMTVKPLKCDYNYYSYIENDDFILYKKDNLIKIHYNNKEKKSFIHIGYYIHSYCKTLILDQILNNMNINDVFGVKLDSIVFKKGSQFDFNKNVFHNDYKKCKIESLLLSSSLLDFNSSDSFNEYSGYVRDYIQDDNYIYDDEERNYNFKPSFLQTGEIIKKRCILMTGKGGAGKTSSLLSALPLKNTCYTTTCWNLIQGKKNEIEEMKKKYDGLLGYSLPSLLGELNEGEYGKKKIVQKVYNSNIKMIIIDEATLWDEKAFYKISNDYKDCFIFVIGDVEDDGFFYQCNIQNKVIDNKKNIFHSVKYFKNYRFDENLNNKLDILRAEMKKNYDNNHIFETVKLLFKDRFFNKEDIIFGDNDIGISEKDDKKNEDELTNYFINKGAKPRYYVKRTYKEKNQLRGQEIMEEPTHKNYELKLFKTIHSFQGLDLTNDNNIIISCKTNFDKNLWYTALSRARRENQIYIIKY